MDIKDYDKLTSAGEILLDLFCGLLPLPLRLREFSEDKLTYQKNAVCDSLTTPCQTKINFCHGILSLPPFFTFWGIPFHCSLYCVVWDGRGCSILVVKLSAGSRLTLGQTENRELSQELPTKGPTIYLLREGVGDFWSSRIFFLAIWWVGYFFPFFPISFLLHLCCMQLFSPDKRLQEFFFSKSPTPAWRVKWSAPKLPCSSTSSWASLLFRAARASQVTWSKRRSCAPYTWYKPRTSKHGGEVGGWKRFRIFYRGFCTDSSLPFKRETHNYKRCLTDRKNGLTLEMFHVGFEKRDSFSA